MKLFHELGSYIPIAVIENELGLPAGKGVAIGILDYSPEWHLIWLVIMDDSREFWCIPNPYMRAQGNPSIGRP